MNSTEQPTTAQRLAAIAATCVARHQIIAYRRVTADADDGRYVVGVRIYGRTNHLVTCIIDVNEAAIMGRLPLEGEQTIGSAIEDRHATLTMGYSR